MSSLPDRKRPRLTQPARALASSLVRWAGHGTWRLLHPGTRGRFLDAPRPAPLERIYYEAQDGWRAPLLRIPPAPGGGGEPVLLAHGMGSSAEALRYGAGPTLAGALSAAGFTVFLWAHRADGEAIPPDARARGQVDFDAILELDLPAAAARVLQSSEDSRLHFVGHGLGGQLGLCWASSRPAELASVVALAAPMRFEGLSTARRTARALALLPDRWRVPLRSAGRWIAPFLDDDALDDELGCSHSPGPRVRGALTYATEDLPVGLLRQVLGWHEAGTVCSRGGTLDRTEALADAQVPLLVVVGDEDRICPPPAGQAALDTWGGPAESLVVPEAGHTDLVLGAQADARVFSPIAAWLVAHRRRSWLDASTIDGTLDPCEELPWPQAANASPRTS